MKFNGKEYSLLGVDEAPWQIDLLRSVFALALVSGSFALIMWLILAFIHGTIGHI